MMIRSQPEGRRSGPGDIDLQVYTVRKFTALALGGNPSILNVLFTPTVHHEGALWARLRDLLQRHAISKRAGPAFLGYQHRPTERWQGRRGQKKVNRPELVEQYGFDTKYAAHVVRLGYQGAAFMLTGVVPIPLPTDVARQIVALRTGALSEQQALDLAHDTEARLLDAIERSPLPEHPGIHAVNTEIAAIYRDWYAAHGSD